MGKTIIIFKTIQPCLFIIVLTNVENNNFNLKNQYSIGNNSVRI